MIIVNNKFYKIFFSSIFLAFLFGTVKAQDQNFANISTLSKWYNPSLKNDKKVTLNMNHRDVRYQGLIGYRSSVGMIDVPLNNGKSQELDNSGFWNLNAGFSLDESNQNILKSSQALLGLSYAVPLTGNNTYLSVSIQGSYFNSRLDLSNASFQDQFDRNGPIANAVSNDPLRSGDSRDWYSGHLGLSFFQNTDSENWSLGIAVRDITNPEINRQSNNSFNLKPTISLQGSYEFKKNQMVYGVQGFVGLKTSAYKQIISFNASHQFNDGNFSAIGSGLAYRFRDAVIPYIDLSFKQSKVALYYEMNISGINASGYNRNAFELSFIHSFAKKVKN